MIMDEPINEELNFCPDIISNYKLGASRAQERSDS